MAFRGVCETRRLKHISSGPRILHHSISQYLAIDSRLSIACDMGGEHSFQGARQVAPDKSRPARARGR